MADSKTMAAVPGGCMLVALLAGTGASPNPGKDKKRLNLIPIVPALTMLLAASIATAKPPNLDAQTAVTYFIGSNDLPGSTRFESLAAFARSVPCLRGGERIWIEAGREFSGRLKLRECVDSSPGDRGAVEIRSVDPNRPDDVSPNVRPAVIRPAVSARSLGLAWSIAPPGTLRHLEASGYADVRALRLGPVDQTVSGLLIGAAWMPSARYPNGDAAPGAPNMVATESISGHGPRCAAALCTAAADPELRRLLTRLEGEDPRTWPRLVLRNSPWSLSSHAIAAIEARTGSIRSTDTAFGENHPTGRLPESGSGILLIGSPALIDAKDEWAQDHSTGLLYLSPSYPATLPDPASTWLLLESDTGEDRAAFADAAIGFFGHAREGRAALSIRIQRIGITGAAGSGIRLQRVGSVEIRDVGISVVGGHGIAVREAAGKVMVQNSRIRHAARNGISIGVADEVLVTGNTVENSGSLREQSALGMDFNGIRVNSFRNVRITGNAVSGVGFAGIMLGEGTRNQAARDAMVVEVSDNRVSDFCRLLNDCGGIYINGQHPKESKITLPPVRRKVVVRNQIDTPRGNLAGLPMAVRAAPGNLPSASTGNWRRFVAAVYLDHGASGYDIHDNEVRGLYEPYGWRAFNRGIGNTCSASVLSQCQASAGAYRCYTGKLEQCNRVPAMPARPPQ